MLIDMLCFYCGKNFKKEKSEIIRQTKKGRDKFFCTLSCGAKWHNGQREDLKREIDKTCSFCGRTFRTMTGAKSAEYCSRSCASKGSMNDSRREAQSRGGLAKKSNLIDVSETLKRREKWKYVRIKSLLDYKRETYEFEYFFEKYVFDLALTKRKIFIEYDGPYHLGPQKNTDYEKDAVAKKAGWLVVRIPVKEEEIFSPDTLSSILI